LGRKSVRRFAGELRYGDIETDASTMAWNRPPGREEPRESLDRTANNRFAVFAAIAEGECRSRSAYGIIVSGTSEKNRCRR
jgi:hypothetical protein